MTYKICEKKICSPWASGGSHNLCHFLACRNITPIVALTFIWRFPGVCALISSFYKGISHAGLEPSLFLCDLTIPTMTLFPNKVTFQGPGG